MIEMDQLQQAWDGLQERYEAQGAQLRTLQRRQRLADLGARLRPLSRALWWQLAIGIALVLWAGGYWVDHLGTPHLVAYGVAIHAYGLGLLVAAALQLAQLKRLDYDAPLLALQASLHRIGRLRVAVERALLCAGLVIWVPFLFAALQRFGFDVWLQRPAVVWWNLGAGVLAAFGVAWWTARRRAAFERDALGPLGDATRALQAESDAGG